MRGNIGIGLDQEIVNSQQFIISWPRYKNPDKSPKNQSRNSPKNDYKFQFYLEIFF